MSGTKVPKTADRGSPGGRREPATQWDRGSILVGSIGQAGILRGEGAVSVLEHLPFFLFPDHRPGHPLKWPYAPIARLAFPLDEPIDVFG